jgi:hypothetical protein
MVEATWANCHFDFAFDGALVDLLVPGTNSDEWEAFWSALQAGPFPLQAFRDGEPIPIPDTAAWALAEREVASVMMSIIIGGLAVHCHFFGGDLELDIDPREVVTESAFESVLAIMRLIAGATRLTVLALSEGGSPPFAFLQVLPTGLAEYLPAGSIHPV